MSSGLQPPDVSAAISQQLQPLMDKLPGGYRQTGDARWDAVTPAPVRRPQ